MNPNLNEFFSEENSISRKSAEPSCVVPFAAAMRNAHLFKGKKVGIILTGGNVDLTKFGTWFPPKND